MCGRATAIWRATTREYTWVWGPKRESAPSRCAGPMAGVRRSVRSTPIALWTSVPHGDLPPRPRKHGNTEGEATETRKRRIRHHGSTGAQKNLLIHDPKFPCFCVSVACSGSVLLCFRGVFFSVSVVLRSRDAAHANTDNHRFLTITSCTLGQTARVRRERRCAFHFAQ